MMPLDTGNAAAGDAAHGYDAPDLRVFVFALFFIFGGITSLDCDALSAPPLQEHRVLKPEQDRL